MRDLSKLNDTELFNVINDTESNNELIIDEAKEVLVKRYEYMTKYMLKYLKLKYNQNEEEDLIQQGYLLINNAINSYRVEKGCAFKSFLFHVIKKGILNQFFQKDKFRKNELTLTSICDEYDFFSTVDTMSSNVSQHNTYDELILEEKMNLIKKHLTESEYNCVIARYYGVSYKEISNAFGYTVKQVDNKIQSVRKDKVKFIRTHC
ncbi:sigma-70 family RNA polymerase sigma factor (plasmid) [Clostridium perfringens]